MPKVKKSTVDRSIRISLAGDLLWDALANRLGLSKTSVLEMLVRDAAAARGMDLTAFEAQAAKDEEE